MRPTAAIRASDGRFADWPLAAKSILAVWLAYAATIAVRAMLSTAPMDMAQSKLPFVIGGVLLTVAIYVVIRLLAHGESLRRKAVIAGIASVAASIGQGAVVVALDDMFDKPGEEFRYQTREGFVVVEKGKEIRIERQAADPLVVTFPDVAELDSRKQVRLVVETAVVWFFFFGGWSAFYLAMVSQAQALGAQRRAAEAEAMARAAQVRALRYQINPHFLFNTLNSLSSLVMTGRAEQAEEMLLKLSNFFRTSLSLDPSADITLAEEIALQRLYLDIERVRFPERLKVDIAVPRDLEKARLPALILQPIVENAIKYGVSPTREPVLLRIAADHAEAGRMRIAITNSAPALGNGADRGTGVGLENVCQRLTARFGSRADCEFGPLVEGGYRVVLTMPLDDTDGRIAA